MQEKTLPYTKTALGGDPLDNVRAIESCRGSRMNPEEANAWLWLFYRQEVAGTC